MSDTLRIDLEEYRKAYEYRKRINSYDPKDLEIYSNGKKIDTTEIVKEWGEYTGMSPVDFLNEYFMEGSEK